MQANNEALCDRGTAPALLMRESVSETVWRQMAETMQVRIAD